MRKPIIFTTLRDRDDMGHRQSGRHTCRLSLAIGCIWAAALVALLATTNHAHAVAGGDDCGVVPGGLCTVNGQQGYWVCVSGTNPKCVIPNPPSNPNQDVLTQHNNNSRWGAQLNETILKPSNVGPNTFGRLYERHVEGQIIAQPLYVSNLSIPNVGVRNVVYVATRENMVYAFDADDTDPDPTHGLIWSYHVVTKPLLIPDDDPVPGMCSETLGPMGITSTPVIDRATNTMYLVARHQMSDHGEIWLHALDIATHADKGRQQIKYTDPQKKQRISYNGVNFNDGKELSRAGLLLVNGAIIIGFSALNCDNSGWHGWVIAYSASDLQYRSAFATTSSSGEGGGIWASGKGIVADTLGNIYFETGNGLVQGTTDLGESFVKLTVGPYSLTHSGHYTVSNSDALNAGDTDLGSSGPLLLPGNRLVGGGKQGKLYVLDPRTMSLTQDPAAGAWVPVVPGGSDGFQAFVNTWHDDPSQPTCMDAHTVLGTRCYMPHPRYEEDEHSGPNIHSGVIYWNGRLYGMPEKDYLKAFNYDQSTGKLEISPAVKSKMRAPDGMPGAAISLSANGSDGIIWASIPKYDGQMQNVPGALVAFRADTLDELWRDDDNIGFAKFNPPTIAGGKVFRPTFADKLIVYGPKSGPTPTSCYTIAQVYANFSGKNGLLGGEIIQPDGIGPAPKIENHRTYAGGAIYWTDKTCAHEVHGATFHWHGVADPTKGIYAEWNGVGLASGFLGYPVTDETVTPDGIGRYNHFQHGSIYWSPTTGAHEVHGAIRAAWAALGWEKSSLGYPVSDETDDPDGNGLVSVFEHGAIHWDRTKGNTFVKPDQIDPNILLGPQEANAYRWSKDGSTTRFSLPPQANPAMCQASCADNRDCRAWTYEASTKTQPPQCSIWSGIPLIAAYNPCCTSGLKVQVQPANMTSMQDDNREGNSLLTFPLPVTDPRLCQGECSENSSCRAWSYHIPNFKEDGTYQQPDDHDPHWCWLLSTPVGAVPAKYHCCSSGAKKN
jgi:hypothetical protein